MKLTLLQTSHKARRGLKRVRPLTHTLTADAQTDAQRAGTLGHAIEAPSATCSVGDLTVLLMEAVWICSINIFLMEARASSCCELGSGARDVKPIITPPNPYANKMCVIISRIRSDG